jgi:hypothetical protein
MERGWDGDMVLANNGGLIAIATGSVPCTEHECGSEELLQALTGFAGQSAKDVAALLKVGSIKSIPSLMERRRIRANLDGIRYEEGEEEGRPVAAIGFAGLGETFHGGLLRQHELQFMRGERDGFVGAWDSGSFGFKVAGGARVRQLREFAKRVHDGKGVFAGTFMMGSNGTQPRGVCIAIEDLLRTEHQEAITKAEAKFEAAVQLELRSRAQELRELGWKHQVPGRSAIGIWAIWKDGVVGSDVAYCVNAGYRSKGPGGPLSFEELRDWLSGADLGSKSVS